MKKKIYICGKVTGDPYYFTNFMCEERRLFSLGYEPINPVACIPANEPWQKAMRTAIRMMLLCDGVSMLPNWRSSKGSKFEVFIAKELGIEVRESKDWKEEGVE